MNWAALRLPVSLVHAYLLGAQEQTGASECVLGSFGYLWSFLGPCPPRLDSTPTSST